MQPVDIEGNRLRAVAAAQGGEEEEAIEDGNMREEGGFFEVKGEEFPVRNVLIRLQPVVQEAAAIEPG